MPSTLIPLHRAAPPKPALGAPCNGCGVCCAAETCPLGRVVFRQRQGPCPALEWHAERYRCGLLAEPRRYLPWLPRGCAGAVHRLLSRWIAAGAGCDSDATCSDGPL
ncbi:MAG: hypothetical protein KA603_08315 [Azonexus sp.]|nr:hypothetical protein [Betaproteobacteria bacterium]MBK8916921.1 hypothetical protein [Betaproteobacteria bacterium]MBP6036122.1 hypothetical protein [Azonexus sp.]MBP6906645.1 hypothetical protein [Azonexus sp.]